MHIAKHLAALAGISILVTAGITHAADSSTPHQEAASQTKEGATPAKESKKIRKHSHPRDEKGIPVSDAPEKKKMDNSAEEGKMRPHDHMRDAK